MASKLDYNTALQFVKKIGVKNGEELLKKDKFGFVEKLILAYKEHVPFQTISILAQTEEEKHVPTYEEVLEAALSLEGGVCYTLNTFMWALLQTLNFKANIVAASYSAFGNNHNHVVVLVSDLRHTGDTFIVDVGCGFPFKDPIPVNGLPCSRYFAGLEYRYQWQDKMIIRLHRSGDNFQEGEKPVMMDGWRQVFHFDLNPVNFDHFRPYMEGIYTRRECDFHTTLRAIRFPPAALLKTPGEAFAHGRKSHGSKPVGNGTIDSFNTERNEDRIMVAFKNQSLLTGPMDNAQKTKIETEDWSKEIKRNFPNIPTYKVDLAVKNMISYA